MTRTTFMTSKIFGCIITCLMLGGSVQSQSIYTIEYRLPQENNATTYYGFLLRYDDGGGLFRVRYTNGQSGEDIVKEMDLAEVPVISSVGIIDSNSVLLKSMNPKTIVGSSSSSFTPPMIVLKNDPRTGFFEPVAITFSETNPTLPEGAGFTVNFMDKEKITKSFLGQYFSEDEDLFNRYFTNTTRGLSPAEKKIRMHLMIVADTVDKSIGSYCAKDIQRVTEMFGGITSYLGIKMIPLIITGKDFSKKNIEDALKKLKPSPADIVVFYYTGHGFRIPERPGRFPNMKLKNFPTVRENFRDSLSWARQSRIDNIKYSMNIEDIFNTIKAKNARFNLVLSDCCNDDIFSVPAKGTKPGKTKSSGIQFSEDNIRNLFLNEKPSSLLVTSAVSGQRSCSNDAFGSFFTYFFQTSLETYCSKLQQPTTWDVIIQSAKKQTATKASGTYCGKNLCLQEADYIKR